MNKEQEEKYVSGVNCPFNIWIHVVLVWQLQSDSLEKKDILLLPWVDLLGKRQKFAAGSLLTPYHHPHCPPTVVCILCKNPNKGVIKRNLPNPLKDWTWGSPSLASGLYQKDFTSRRRFTYSQPLDTSALEPVSCQPHLSTLANGPFVLL